MPFAPSTNPNLYQPLTPPSKIQNSSITLDGEAKAYPVSVLRFREMINDELAGIPILVSW